MDSEQVIRVALTIVTPILTAGIGIVALVIGDWRERRDPTRLGAKLSPSRRRQAGHVRRGMVRTPAS